MAAPKPTLVPRWADVAGVISEPPSGIKDTGHVFAELPDPEFENWLKNLYQQWIEYLRDGAFTGAIALAGRVDASFLVGGSAVYLTEADVPGLSQAQVIYVTGAAAGGQILSGIEGGTDGRIIVVHFDAAAGTGMVVENEAITVTAAHRILLPLSIAGTPDSLTVRRRGSIIFKYDGTAARWRPIGGMGVEG